MVEQSNRHLSHLRSGACAPGRTRRALVRSRPCGAGGDRTVSARPDDAEYRLRRGFFGAVRGANAAAANAYCLHLAGACGARRCKRIAWARAQRCRNRLSRQCVPGARPRPHRCRIDDVRAGQLGTLPAQDLQRTLDDRRRRRTTFVVRHDSQHAPADQRCRHSVGVFRQRRRHRGLSHAALAGRPDQPTLSLCRGTGARADEGGNAQSSNGHCTVSGCRDRVGRGNPRRRRGGPRVETKSRAGGIHDVSSEHSG